MMRVLVVGGPELIEKLRGAGPISQKGIVSRVTRLALQLQTRVKAEKLSGQVLHVRTGTLRRSINMKIEQDAHSVTGQVGTNVEYAAVHEFGGRHTIPAHVRLVKKAFGRTLRTPVWSTVKEHEVQVPERSFLRSALKEMEPQIQRELTEELTRAVQEAMR